MPTQFNSVVQGIYIAYYGRPADPTGLAFWTQQLANVNGDLNQIIDSFGNSAEAAVRFGSGSNEAKINQIYQQIFGRDADTEGLLFYSTRLADGTFTLANIAKVILDGVQPGTQDAAIVDNKLAVAARFTAGLDTTQEILAYSSEATAQLAIALLAGVGATTDPATVDVDATITQIVATGSNNANPGQTFTLTTGADTINGTGGNDIINALAVDAQGGDATTFSAFDAIDGGAGTDTLNIFTDQVGGFNNAIPATTTVKNVEIVNILNGNGAANIANAARFEGVQQLWQVADANTVTNLGAGTTAGFRTLEGLALSVETADSAASAAIAFDRVGDDVTLGVNGATGVLNSVTISGTLVDTAAAPGDGIDAIVTTVDLGEDQSSLTLNTSIAVDLTVTAGANEDFTTLNAAASTGAIEFTGAATVSSITTGAGADDVTLAFTATATSKAATVSTGAGNDVITAGVNANGQTGVTLTVDAGAGDDEIEIDNTGTVAVTVNAGAGNDLVILTDGIDSVATTDKIDGGAGTDTVQIAGKTLDAEDYVLLNNVITNFEAISFVTSAANVDASRVANYKAFSFAGAAGTATKVAADQALTTAVGLTATAAGYVLDSDPNTAGNQTVYAGTLNITAVASATVTANAETVNLTVTPVSDDDGAVDNTAVTLVGDAKVVNVTLNATTDDNGTPATADDVLETSSLTLTNAAANAALTTLTISGNGSATVTNVDGKALVTVNASGLAPVDVDGEVLAGLNYTTSNTEAETITLSSGLDSLSIRGSTFAASDTINGFTLVDDAAVAGKQVDTTKSDSIVVRANDGVLALTTFVKVEDVSAASLELALVNLAAGADDKVVFQFGGDTYIFADVAIDGTAGDDILNDTDVLVKLTGLVDLDLLVDALG